MTDMNELDWLKQQTTSSPLSKISPQESLDNARRLMELFGNPQDAVPAIHIAGTMGKGTVTKIVTNILVTHGKKVVSIYSPHTYEQRERIELNSEMISEIDFERQISKLQAVETGRMTYFNAMMLMGFLYAREQEADFVVVETGLGGKYDTSNTITRPDKLCVLTKIGFDHVGILGDSLDKIAVQKAGIIGEGSRALSSGDQAPEVKAVFEQTAEAASAKLSYSEATAFELAEFNPRLLGNFSRYNVQLALDTAREMLGGDFDEEKARQSLKEFALPGRFDVFKNESGEFVFDTAHNIAQVTALQQTWTQVYGGKKPGLIFASSNPEHAAQCLDLLSDWCGPIIITKYSEPSLDLWKPAVDLTHERAIATQTADEAIIQMKEQYPEQTLWLVTGSTYHLNEIRQLIL